MKPLSPRAECVCVYRCVCLCVCTRVCPGRGWLVLDEGRLRQVMSHHRIVSVSRIPITIVTSPWWQTTPTHHCICNLYLTSTHTYAHTHLSYDIKNGNILCFTESWLNEDIINIQLAGYTLYWEDRTEASGKGGGGLCIYINNSWCTISKEVSRFGSPEVEYLMISCRPHYLPREFSFVFFVAWTYHHWPMLALRPHSNSCIQPYANRKTLIQRRRS
jgi:hypothetical protein